MNICSTTPKPEPMVVAAVAADNVMGKPEVPEVYDTAQPSAPPATSPDAPPAAADAALDLSTALAQVNLSEYEDALIELGVSAPADLADLEEADCIEIGMKKLEVRRLMRIAS